MPLPSRHITGRTFAVAALLSGLLLTGATAGHRNVTAPPPQLAVDPFYVKYVDADGVPVVASGRVPDAALLAAAGIVEQELAHRPDVRFAVVRTGLHLSIIAQEESITDLPEQRNLEKPGPSDARLTLCEQKHYDRLVAPLSARAYWAGRARGLGGENPIGGAENLLGIAGTLNFGENILVHEFAHVVLRAVQQVDPRLYRRVETAYAEAMTRRKWKGDYASVNVHEYWAEGTQYWFNTNMVARLPDGAVRTSEDLRHYDPKLYRLLGQVYGSAHQIPRDPFYRHPAQLYIPEGWQSSDCP